MSEKEKDINLSFFIKIFLVYLCLTAAMLLGLLLFFKSVNWVDLSPESITSIPESLMLYDANDKLAATTNGGENRIFISIKDMPQHVKLAFVAAEDARFYDHSGIDIKRIFGAALADLKAGYYKEGGSTITQQLIKNSHLTGTKKLSRKIQEALLACQLESRYSKDQILEMYLNYIYFGNGAYGIEAAAQTYFSKSAAELTTAEAAAIAGVIKSPTNYSPSANPDKCLARRNTVLELMYKYNFINNETYEQALQESLSVKSNSLLQYSHGYYMDEVLRSAAEKTGLSVDELISGGYNIYTTLDPSLSQKLEEILKLDEVFPQEKDGRVECAVVVLDSKTGAVLALAGGREYQTRMGFNRATMAKRSPGSSIKPLLVYAPAIDSKVITAASILSDEKKDFDGYSPNNFHDKYYGNVTVRDALVKSLNIPAVEILQDLGVENGKKYAEKLGIKFDKKDKNLSLALGGFTKGVSPLELASGYQCLANGGVHNTTYNIRRITDSSGAIVYQNSAAKGNPVYSPETSYIVSDILNDAANKYGSPFGKLKKQQISAKTGTASYGDKGNSDIWVAAYNSEYTITVWEGYDQTDSSHYLPGTATGSKYPSVIAASLFNFIYSDGSAAPAVNRPSGVIEASLDKDALYSGSIELATDLTPEKSRKKELFIKGTEPTGYSEYYSVPKECPITVTLQDKVPVISISPLNSYTYYRVYRIMNGEHLQIATLNGKGGQTLTINDESAVGDVKYYVIPEHMSIKNPDGSPLLGKASRLISISLNQEETPEPTEPPDASPPELRQNQRTSITSEVSTARLSISEASKQSSASLISSSVG